MKLIGLQVSHPAFGAGKVAAMNGSYMQVKFASGEAKSFLYPDAFDGFLKPECDDRAEIDEALRMRKREAQQQKLKQLDSLAAMRTARVKANAPKRPAAKKPKAAPAAKAASTGTAQV